MGEQFPCPKCGAELQWSPGDGDLTCAYCGHVHHDSAPESGPGAGTEAADVRLESVSAEVQEYRLDQAALKAVRGWGTEVRELKCGNCAAVSTIGPEVTATACSFCGSDRTDLQSVDDTTIKPESLLPFGVDQKQAGRKFKDWLGGLWFRPSDLKRMASMGRITGAYIPVWTFDAASRSKWTAEAGFYYYEERVVERVVDGERQQVTEKVRKTRWEPARGKDRQSFDDWLIQASKGIDQKLFEGLLPFDTSALRPYEPRFLAGFVAERYQLDLEPAWDAAQQGMGAVIESACRKKVPGDTQRNLRVRTKYRDVTFKHCLLPLWIAAYQYRGETYRYVVNGVTGKAHGTSPLSWPKIIALILFIMAVIGCFCGLTSLIGGGAATVNAY